MSKNFLKEFSVKEPISSEVSDMLELKRPSSSSLDVGDQLLEVESCFCFSLLSQPSTFSFDTLFVVLFFT